MMILVIPASTTLYVTRTTQHADLRVADAHVHARVSLRGGLGVVAVRTCSTRVEASTLETDLIRFFRPPAAIAGYSELEVESWTEGSGAVERKEVGGG